MTGNSTSRNAREMEEVLADDFDYTLGDIEGPDLKSSPLNDTVHVDHDQKHDGSTAVGLNKRVPRSVLVLHGVASGSKFDQRIPGGNVDLEHDADSFGISSCDLPENVTYINTMPNGASASNLVHDDNDMDELILQTTDLSNSPMLSDLPETPGEHGQDLDHLQMAYSAMNQARAAQNMRNSSAAALAGLFRPANERCEVRTGSVSAPNSMDLRAAAKSLSAGDQAGAPPTPMQAAHALFEQAVARGMDDQTLMQLAVSLGLLAPGEQDTPTSARTARTCGATCNDPSYLGINASLIPAITHMSQGLSATSNLTASSTSVSEPLPKLAHGTLIGLGQFNAPTAGLDLGGSNSLTAALGLMSASRLLSSPGGSGPAKVHALYKTELCRGWLESGTCRYGSKCQFAHGPSELRPVPRHPKYKTEVCRSFTATGMCAYGQRCRFIHGSMSAPHNALFGGDRMNSGNLEGLEGVLGFEDVSPRTSAVQQLANLTASGQALPPSLAATAAALRFATGNTNGSGLVHSSAPMNVLNRSSLNQLSSGGLVGIASNDLGAYAAPGVGSGDLSSGNALQQLAMPPGLVPGVNMTSAGRSNVSGRSSLDGFLARANLRSALGLRGSDSSSSVLSEMLRRSSLDAARSSLETATSSRGRSSIESIASSQQQQQLDMLSVQDSQNVLNALAAAAAAAGASQADFQGGVTGQTYTNLYTSAGLVAADRSQQLFGNYTGLPKIPEGIPVQNPVMPTGLGKGADLGNTADLIQQINKLSLAQAGGNFGNSSAAGVLPLTSAQQTLLLALQQQQQQQQQQKLMVCSNTGGNEQQGAWFAKSQWWENSNSNHQSGTNQTKL